jgi:hypothetical protein
VYALAEDGKDPDLLFAGTEFGAFFTVDRGKRWVKLEGGIPTIAVFDLAVQRQENDLVAGTFGRGFYILDDYAPLRSVNDTFLAQKAALLRVRDAPMYIPARPYGGRGKASQGDAFFTAPNPPFGAVFTYYLKDAFKTRKEEREAREKKLEKEGKPAYYPPWDTLRAESRETKPEILLTVTDAGGNVVRRITGPVSAGFHRVAWDLRYPAPNPVALKPPPAEEWWRIPRGPLAAPGTYSVSMTLLKDGAETPLAGPQSFRASPVDRGTLPAPDRDALVAFQDSTARLQRAVLGAVKAAGEAKTRLEYLRRAFTETPGADPSLLEQTRALELRLDDLMTVLTGDKTRRKYEAPTPPSITQRVDQIVEGEWESTSAPTETHRRNYAIAATQFEGMLGKLRTLVEVDLKALEQKAEAAGAPWTPGRLPDWKRD